MAQQLLRSTKILHDFTAAGLDIDQQIVGRKFEALGKDAREFALFGTIIAIEWWEDGGIRLFISNERLWTLPLRYLRFNKGNWEIIYSENNIKRLDVFKLL